MAASRSWAQHAACRDMDPNVFFPDWGGNTDEAVAVCRRCPVRASCLHHAMTTPERHGVWGGLTETERKRGMRLCSRCGEPSSSARAAYCDDCRLIVRAETVAYHSLARSL